MTISDETLDVLHRIAAELEREGPIEVGTMLRSPGIRTGGKIVALLGADDRFLIKLPRGRATELVESGRASFVAMGSRRMREWVEISGAADPDSTLAMWLPFAREAFAYVRHSPRQDGP